ncbi:dihydrodipicolinate synthase family protein [Portibacter lacus]|uniref:Dihydrodipicolinate synthase family protein n=1 Tax=Portibacter lacus TaxID=1099794 RepID=A0AA37SS40_9BACT|nr:dihydrodipicolinate synthase family protein [Portibacter lacus]GLR17781.1 dihydrodipicolinate synthase family protein [Portibacter lacus]
MVKWEGVIPAITTKFKEDLSLDIDAFNNNTKAQVEAGINGLVIGGSLGESSTITHEERMILLNETKSFVNGAIPVIVNIAESSTKDAISLARLAQDNGADGLMVLPPMMYKSTDEETTVWFETIAKNTDLPILVYNNPVDYKIEVTLDIFERLVKQENIKAVKESTRDTTNITRIRNRFGDRLKVLCGVDTLALESMLLGADGWLAGLVAAFPRETCAIYYLVKAGRVQEAINIYRWFMPLLELDINPQLVQNIKLAEQYTGLGNENVRAPRMVLQGAERQRVIDIIEKSLKTRPELPKYLDL